MSRASEQKFVTRWWGVYFLYFVVMGSLGAAGAHLGSSLTKTVVASAGENDGEPGRALSRVERHASLKIPPQLDAVHSPVRPVTAMVRPDIHPGVLAASLDRAEQVDVSAADVSPAESTPVAAALTADTIRVAACTLPTCITATRVKGWKKTFTANAAIKTASRPNQKLLRIAARKSGPKAKHSSAAKVVAHESKSLPLAVVLASAKPSTALPGAIASKRPLRLAITPGELISRSLRGTS